MKDTLAHYGKKGMKWGVRQNPNYSNDQAKRDSIIYGNRGSKRINKAMNSGDSVSTARAGEKTRRDRVMNRNPHARNIGKIIGAIVGGAGVNVGISALSRFPATKLGSSFLKTAGARVTLNATMAALRDPVLRGALTVGVGSIGSKLAGDLGVATNMRLNGYNATRKK